MTFVLVTAAVIDRVLTAFAVIAIGWLLVRMVRARAAGDRDLFLAAPSIALSRRREMAALAFILVVAAFFRLVALSEPVTPSYWDAQVNTVLVQRMLDTGRFTETLRGLLKPYQGFSYFTSLAVLLPVAAALQRLLGPSLELQGYLGAFFALLGIILAWALGRAYRGPLFGLLFAAFLATSLANLVWSRVGGTYLGGIPHVLGVSLLGFEAGRRRSGLLAIAAGCLTWLALYNHYQARVCFPLVYVAVVAGASRHPRPWRSAAIIAFITTCVLYTAYHAGLNNGSFRATLWPSMGGDVGNQGESSFADVLQKNLEPMLTRLRQCLWIMFGGSRSTAAAVSRWGLGLEGGGSLLAPSIVLGGIGLIVCLARIHRELLPLAIAGLGLIISVLSEAQTRKLLIFDLGWQFLAAIGLYELLRHRSVARRGMRALAWSAGVAYVATAGWGFAALAAVTLHARDLAMPFRQFAVPLFGDMFDGARTQPIARQWESWIQQGFVVVWVNTDNASNNFATYGAVAALSRGRPGWFQPFHAVDGSASISSSHLTELLGREHPFAEAFMQKVRGLGAQGVAWWFERPTRWDQWFVDELGRQGGEVHSWPAETSRPPWEPSRYVVFGPSSLDGVSPALEAIDARPLRPARVCLGLERTERQFLTVPNVNAIVRLRPDVSFVVAGTEARVGTQVIPLPGRGIGAVRSGAAEVLVMDINGTESRFDVPASAPAALRASTRRVMLRSGTQVGTNCAARIGEDWWLVDPVHGWVMGSQPVDWIPSRPWVAVTSDGDRLLLASADQHIAVLRPDTRTVEKEFPAHVWQSFRYFDWGACPIVGVVDGYVSSVEPGSTSMALYTLWGDQVAAVRLDDVVRELSGAGMTGVEAEAGMLTLLQTLPPMRQSFREQIDSTGRGCERGLRLVTLPAMSTRTSSAPTTDVAIGGIHPFAVTQDWGEPRQDRSVMGLPLQSVDGVVRPGIGVHATSDMVFALQGKFRRFRSGGGLTRTPDGHEGSVQFEVYGDGRLLWQSDLVHRGSALVTCDVDVNGIEQLELHVTDGGDGIAYDHAAWFDPTLE